GDWRGPDRRIRRAHSPVRYTGRRPQGDHGHRRDVQQRPRCADPRLGRAGRSTCMERGDHPPRVDGPRRHGSRNDDRVRPTGRGRAGWRRSGDRPEVHQRGRHRPFGGTFPAQPAHRPGFGLAPISLHLFVVGVVLIIVAVKTPGHGVFRLEAIIAIILAAAFLAPLRPPHFLVSPDYQLYFLAALLTPTGFFGGFLLFAMYKVQQVRHRTPIVGEMVGLPAIVKDGLRPGEKGYVMHRGELWQAVSDENLPAESKAYIRAVDGIVLRVASAPPPAAAPAHAARNWLASLLRRKAAW